jgi:hypothetical protein
MTRRKTLPVIATRKMPEDDHRSIALSAAGSLRFAAAPTFAVMALLTGALGGGQADILCAQAASPLSGMTAMYLLMSAFHSAPWLKLINR